MECKELIERVEARCKEFPERHQGIEWEAVKAALETSDRIDILLRMEEADGEVDVVKAEDGHFWFFDCAKESPVCRRAICYDEAAWAARKANKPVSSAEKVAAELGAEILNEADYRYLQTLGEFDVKSQSWIKADDAFRSKGDALFGNKRHGVTFVYYNGVQSYYSTRGVRCKVRI